MSAPTCWVVTDGKAGMESQCLALADALGLVPVVKRVKLRSPWKQLSPVLLRAGHRWSLSAEGDRLDGAPPDLLIATGRQSVSSSLALRTLSRGRTFRVQIQDPAIHPANFDLVVVPRHDGLRAANVVVTKGALHKVTPRALADARDRFAGRFGFLPQPRVAVLVGGSNAAYRLTPATTTTLLAERLAALATSHGAALLVTPSRRTGGDNIAVLRRHLDGVPGEVWDGTGDNPYLGYLAYADAVVVTADSVNMVCEACATGKPVHVVDLDGGSPKFRRFHQGLRADGCTRVFDGRLDGWSYQPFDDAGLAAAAVRRRLEARGIVW